MHIITNGKVVESRLHIHVPSGKGGDFIMLSQPRYLGRKNTWKNMQWQKKVIDSSYQEDVWSLSFVVFVNNFTLVTSISLINILWLRVQTCTVKMKNSSFHWVSTLGTFSTCAGPANCQERHDVLSFGWYNFCDDGHSTHSHWRHSQFDWWVYVSRHVFPTR